MCPSPHRIVLELVLPELPSVLGTCRDEHGPCQGTKLPRALAEMPWTPDQAWWISIGRDSDGGLDEDLR